jgi:hypothetical protein
MRFRFGSCALRARLNQQWPPDHAGICVDIATLLSKAGVPLKLLGLEGLLLTK